MHQYLRIDKRNGHALRGCRKERPLSAPPGWYPDESGQHHYWDGRIWMSRPAQPGAPSRTESGVIGMVALIVGVYLAVPTIIVVFVFTAGAIARHGR